MSFRIKMLSLGAAIFALLFWAFSSSLFNKGLRSSSPQAAVSPTTTFVKKSQIAQSYAHDPQAFTQGLLYDNGFFYESTGLYGKSSLRKVEVSTGKVLQEKKIPSQYFAEGLVLWKGRLIQLTWRSHVGFVYDKNSFAQLATFSYPTEGWGLTHDGSHLIMSDGTATLRFLDPDSFKVVRTIEVHDQKGPVDQLNELEMIRGEIWANVWRTNTIVKIDPQSGALTGVLNLRALTDSVAARARIDVLNGIAYDAAQNRVFITGKLWPTLFEIEVE